MAHWRSIGAVQSIAAGRTQVWHITYGTGRDVGVVVAAPNLHDTGAELIAFDRGVLARAVGEELGSQTVYTVKIRNAGSSGINYNLNIGDWQNDVGAQAPTAVRVRQLPPGLGGVVVGPPLVLARRAKNKGARKAARKRKAPRKKAARRR